MSLDIPIIDLTAFRDGTDPDSVAAAIADACEYSGFFIVTGHGVDLDLIEAARAQALDFFHLPEQDKLALAPHPYSPYRAERLSYSRGEESPPDLKEAFGVGHPDGSRTPGFSPPNVFPAAVPQLEAVSYAYYRALETLCGEIQELFALALGLPREYFVATSDRHFSSLRYVYYPPPSETPVPGQMRAGTHTDYGDFTLVHIEDAPGGLQVLSRSGAFVDAPVVPGAFVVNIGDLMEVWTNDRFVSTLHRVVIPEADRVVDSERLSLVFFHEPNWDTEVRALPTCVDDDHPPRYAPLSAGEHLEMKVNRQRTLATGA